MKKYSLIALMILNTHQFFAGTALVEHWKKSDHTAARMIWTRFLSEEQKVSLLSDLIDDASDKLKQCYKDNNFLVRRRGFKLDRFLIPHYDIIEMFSLNEELIVAKFDFLFSQVYSDKERKDIQNVADGLDLYYDILKYYAVQNKMSLKELNQKENIIEILSNLVPSEWRLSGKFAQVDSKEQQLFKKCLLEKEA